MHSAGSIDAAGKVHRSSGAKSAPHDDSRPYYSVMTWSAHSISETKIGGLPNFAP